MLLGRSTRLARKEVPWEVSLPGFGIGMINDDFHIAGIRQVVAKRLKRVVMVFNGPRSEMLQVEDAEFVGAKGLTISAALDCSHN